MQCEVVGQVGFGPQLPEAVDEFAERRRRWDLGVDDRLDGLRDAVLHWLAHAPPSVEQSTPIPSMWVNE